MCTNTKLYKALPHLVSECHYDVTDVSVSHGPALSVQAGAGAGVGVVKTHGVHCPPRCTG